jgi:hypothetical protein
MNEKPILYNDTPIEQVILLVRGQKVILDRDLAALYGVPTKSLNRAVKRNLDRFPSDFMIQLTAEEAESSRCQIGTLLYFGLSPFLTSQKKVEKKIILYLLFLPNDLVL